MRHFKSRNWEPAEALCSDTAATSPPAPSICGSLGRQSPLDIEPSVRGTQPCTKSFEKLTERAFIHLPSRSSRKLRKPCQKRGNVPTSGLELWSSRRGRVEESWSRTRPGRCLALECQKNTDAPRGLVAYESLCLSALRSPFFWKISVALAWKHQIR